MTHDPLEDVFAVAITSRSIAQMENNRLRMERAIAVRANAILMVNEAKKDEEIERLTKLVDALGAMLEESNKEIEELRAIIALDNQAHRPQTATERWIAENARRMGQ